MHPELIALIGHLEHDAVNKVLFKFPFKWSSGITDFCELCKRAAPCGTSRDCYLWTCSIGENWEGLICVACRGKLTLDARFDWSSARDHDGNRTHDDDGIPLPKHAAKLAAWRATKAP